jgi:anti-sigma-K factor RskA
MSNLTEDDIALAGEFALGLLDEAQTAQANARCTADAEFAAEVEAWRERLLPMLADVSAKPPAYAWDKISSAIGPANALLAPANDNAALRFWKGLTAVSGALAAALAVALFVQQPTEPAGDLVVAGNVQADEQTMVAALQSETGPSTATASYDPASGKLLITPVSMDTGDLYPEVWIIPADGKARSLGVVSRSGASQHKISPDLRQYMAQGATLAITPEPANGAPGGKATGPVMASGKLAII